MKNKLLQLSFKNVGLNPKSRIFDPLNLKIK